MLNPIKNSSTDKPLGELVLPPGLVHDMRNALTPILIHLHLLTQYTERVGPEAEAIKNSIQAIEQSVATMVALLKTTY